MTRLDVRDGPVPWDSLSRRLKVRFAQTVYERLTQRYAARAPLVYPIGLDDRLRQVAASVRRHDLAYRRGYLAYSVRNNRPLRKLLSELRSALLMAVNNLDSSTYDPARLGGGPVPEEIQRPAGILADLEALGRTGMYTGVRINVENLEVDAVTGRVVLRCTQRQRDWDLGPFRVTGSLSYASSTFRAEALKPRPHYLGDIVHPHVNGQRGTVCLGEGEKAVSAAWQEGRLLDSFVLCHAVLSTYSRNNPYAFLEEWDGPDARCNNCQIRWSAAGGLGMCLRCNRYACGSCRATCACTRDVCHNCSVLVRSTGVRSCLLCTLGCGVCGERVPPTGLRKSGHDGRLVCVVCGDWCCRCMRWFQRDRLGLGGLCAACVATEEIAALGATLSVNGVVVGQIEELVAVSETDRTDFEMPF